MRTFKKKNPVLVKVESSPNSKKVSLFNDINSDDEKKQKRNRRKSNDIFDENVFDETLKEKTKKRSSLDSSSLSSSTKQQQSTPKKSPKTSSSKQQSSTPSKSPKVGTPKTPNSKSPGGSGKKRSTTTSNMEDNFFSDDLFDDVFDYSSSEDEHGEKEIRALKKQKRMTNSSSSIKVSGKELDKKESILNYLGGLSSRSLDTKCSSASSLAQMFSQEGNDMGIFLRAHSMVKSMVETLCTVIDFENQQLLSLTASQIISILLKDPLNAEYATENSFITLHEIIKQHHVLKWQQTSNLDSIKRTKRTRMAALKAGSPKKAQKEQTKVVDEDANIKTFEKTTISLALSAMVNIVNYEHHNFELKYHQSSNKEEFLAKNKPNLLFIKSNSIETIERLVPCLLAIMEQERDDLISGDMCNCIKMLEKNGIVTKYSNSSDPTKNAEAWNYFLPALIRLLNCLTPINKPLLSELKDGHPVLECTLITLRFLTNISNCNNDVCHKITEENGISGICSVLASNYTQHFDILTMSLALLSNMTDSSWTNRELIRNFKFEFRGKTKKLLQFLIDLFKEYYAKQDYKDEDEQSSVVTVPDDQTMVGSDSQRSDNAAADIVDKVSNEKKENENKGYNRSSSLQHTEDNIITSYLAILIGCLCKDHEANRDLIQKELPENSFISLIIALKAFVIYQSKARLLTKETFDSISTILKDLEENRISN